MSLIRVDSHLQCLAVTPTTSANSNSNDAHSFDKAMLKHDLAQSKEFTPPRLVRFGCFVHLIAPNEAA